MRKNPPLELINALNDYIERYPEKGKTKVMSGRSSYYMKDIAEEIRKGTKIGIDYEKALYKMAFEDLLHGRKFI